MNDYVEVLEGIGRGERPAQVRLWSEFRPKLVAFARRSLDADEAEDVATEALMKYVFDSALRPEARVAFPGYLYAIAASRIRDVQRRRSRWLRLVERLSRIGQSVSSRQMDFDVIALDTCVARLPEADRDLLDDVYLRRIKQTELAARGAGSSKQGVNNRLRRIRAILRHCLLRKRLDFDRQPVDRTDVEDEYGWSA